MQRTFVLIFAFAIVAAAAGGGAYWYATRNSPEAMAEERAGTIVEMVAKHMILPADEEPTVATVTDLAQLAGQPFFKNAKVGYQVLIYTKAGKAILYDPVADRIVEAAPLSVNISTQ